MSKLALKMQLKAPPPLSMFTFESFFFFFWPPSSHADIRVKTLDDGILCNDSNFSISKEEKNKKKKLQLPASKVITTSKL